MFIVATLGADDRPSVSWHVFESDAYIHIYICVCRKRFGYRHRDDTYRGVDTNVHIDAHIDADVDIGVGKEINIDAR